MPIKRASVKTAFSGVKKLSEGCCDCIHFVICSKKAVKNVRKDTDGCQWGKSHFIKDDQ